MRHLYTWTKNMKKLTSICNRSKFGEVRNKQRAKETLKWQNIDMWTSLRLGNVPFQISWKLVGRSMFIILTYLHVIHRINSHRKTQRIEEVKRPKSELENLSPKMRLSTLSKLLKKSLMCSLCWNIWAPPKSMASLFIVVVPSKDKLES